MGFLTTASGTYVGNGTTQSITGLGFTPKSIWVKSATNAAATGWATTAMPAGTTLRLTALVSVADGITSIDTNGFTVGAGAVANTNAVTYLWWAMTGDPAHFEVGTYTAAASPVDGRDIVLAGAFRPTFVTVGQDGAVDKVYRTTDFVGDLAGQFNGSEASDIIQALNSNGFQIGTSDRVQAASQVYYYLATSYVSPIFQTATYTGNATDNTLISFSPATVTSPFFVMVKSKGANGGIWGTTASGANSGYTFGAFATGTDRVKTYVAGGFTIGTSSAVNTNLQAYRYASFTSGQFPDRVGGTRILMTGAGV